MEVVLRCENDVQFDAFTVVDFTMLYVSLARILLLVSRAGCYKGRLFRTTTAPGSEVLFPFEVVHLARSRLGSAPTSKGLFSRCVENVSRYESFVCLYSFFFSGLLVFAT